MQGPYATARGAEIKAHFYCDRIKFNAIYECHIIYLGIRIAILSYFQIPRAPAQNFPHARSK